MKVDGDSLWEENLHLVNQFLKKTRFVRVFQWEGEICEYEWDLYDEACKGSNLNVAECKLTSIMEYVKGVNPKVKIGFFFAFKLWCIGRVVHTNIQISQAFFKM